MGQGGPNESGPAIGSPLSHHEVSSQVDVGPAFTQGGRLGTKLDEKVAEGRAFLLSEAEFGHGRILWK